MKTIEFYIHVFAHEMHDFQRIVEALKRNLAFVDETRYSFNLTLNVSDYHYDWNKSKLTPAFFVKQFEGLSCMLPNVTSHIEYFEEYGCNTVRRHAMKSDKDFVGYLDLDVHFSVYTFFLLDSALQKLALEPHDWNRTEEVILSGQIPRLWDDSWNIISNQKYIDMGVDSKIWLKLDPYSVDKLVQEQLSNIEVKPIPYVKIGGGWMNILETSILRDIGIPDSFGAYGRDDTFIADACNLLNKNGKKYRQYVVDNLLVFENRKYESYEPYLSEDLVVLAHDLNDYKTSRAKTAADKYNEELDKVMKRLGNE